jgi:RNA polymerase sigma-70 factor, ECF subfamily
MVGGSCRPGPGVMGMDSQRFKELAAPSLLNALLLQARRLTRNNADAKDLLQDTLERGLRHYDRFCYGSLAVWLARVMHNLFIDRCRRRRTDPLPLEHDHTPVAAVLSPSPRWMRVSDELLQQAVATLDPLSREIFLKHEVVGRSYNQIAADLGIAPATVGSRLFRTRLKIREYLCSALPADGVAHE